ncbi:threonine 3-dehydrogenase [Flavobacteriales bacterium]|nr:putative epimerase/dehydratase [Flavobacteriales bacterium]MCL4815368.1 NAD-dependent epimerase/dehydratase family protein [Flavobacteriales bacterium]WKZ74987.1 MAG: NAD-dependent epimerase/dehydratase family protein [Vicingaceae bacterium]GIK69929.1 MAG: L-threonine 3-dehydrogenase [Bacteroidota bacterium]CAG0960268.1 threonine 3-dehydrogenase [Flavobacteriales bacterium]
MKKILVIGSKGQIGGELVERLRKMYGEENVISSDIKEDDNSSGMYEKLDVLNKEDLFSVIKKHAVNEIYLLAALLSATAEKNPAFGWKLNMESLFNILDLAKEKQIAKVYWPSSIAVFGPTTPKTNTPQYTIMEPSTVYGISKLAGERWCEYYYNKYNVDVRSLRYPGLIGWKSMPGGGTTDYAVDIFHQAIKTKRYECFLGENTTLPMMYMEDAIRATIELMQANPTCLSIRSSYNLAGMSFNPKEISTEIKKFIPDFNIIYKPDYRQQIADSWPQSIDDKEAKNDWNWKPNYNLEKLTQTMIKNLS